MASRYCPLSNEQQRFYILHQINPNSPELHLSWAVEIRGKLDVDKINMSFQHVVNRAPILSAAIVLDDSGSPKLLFKENSKAEIRFKDLTAASEQSKQQTTVDKLIHAEANATEAFSLESGNLYRCHLT